MLLRKTGCLLSCGPEGCWDGEPRPRGEIGFWRRTMFRNEPLWAVYTVLKQHYSYPAAGKTNRNQIKTPHYCHHSLLVAAGCITPTEKNKLHIFWHQVCLPSDSLNSSSVLSYLLNRSICFILCNI